ncbi:MAG TPA: diguanylate cyclase [Rhodanobacteraceae bacterium]
MTVRGLGHVNLRGSGAMIEQLRRFYTNVMGLREGPRLTFRSGSRGYWLYAGAAAVLHLTVDDGAGTGDGPAVFDHFALECDDLAGVRARLDAASVDYAVDTIDTLHQEQLSLTDPAGIGVELTFTVPPAVA